MELGLRSKSKFMMRKKSGLRQIHSDENFRRRWGHLVGLVFLCSSPFKAGVPTPPERVPLEACALTMSGVNRVGKDVVRLTCSLNHTQIKVVVSGNSLNLKTFSFILDVCFIQSIFLSNIE